MRIYQPIWDTLKEKKKIVLIDSKSRHKRIVKAVKKERTMDSSFRLDCDITGKKVILKNVSEGNKLTLYLTTKVAGINEL